MAMHFFYTAQGRQRGPVSLEQLKQLALRSELQRSDKVWCKGMKSWSRADLVPELFDEPPPELPAEDSSERPGSGSGLESRPASVPAAPVDLVRAANDGIDKFIAFLAPPDVEAPASPKCLAPNTKTDAKSEPRDAANNQPMGELPGTGQADPAPLKKCAYCGRDNYANQSRCSECGMTEFVAANEVASTAGPEALRPAAGPNRTGGVEPQRQLRTPLPARKEWTKALGAMAAVILASAAFVGAAYLWHGHSVSTMRRAQAQAKAVMQDNLRKGLVGLGTQNGVRELGNPIENKRYWHSALEAAKRAARLNEQIKESEWKFPLNRAWWGMKGLALGIKVEPEIRVDPLADLTVFELTDALLQLNSLERIFQRHAVLDEQEARVFASFLMHANSFATDLQMPLPFPAAADQGTMTR